MKENIYGYTLEQLVNLTNRLNQPEFRSKQLFEWLYKKRVEAFDEMTSLSKEFRQILKSECVINKDHIFKEYHDQEDHTKKYIIELQDGEIIETVLMSYHHGYSVCVSSQVGCRMGCQFCASTIGGLSRNLSTAEIISQIDIIEKNEKIRIGNVVMMGIGEPFDNFDNVKNAVEIMNTGFQIGQRKITISTCGIIPGIIKWADFKNQTNLAISLHSPFQDKREEIMPIAKKYNLKELIDACQYFQKQTNRRITFEYALINKFNDREEDIKELIKIAGQVYCHINLIRLNDVEESMLVPSKKVKNVFNKLQSNGINCTIRRSVGKNIEAACGQLRHKIENANERG